MKTVTTNNVHIIDERKTDKQIKMVFIFYLVTMTCLCGLVLYFVN